MILLSFILSFSDVYYVISYKNIIIHENQLSFITIMAMNDKMSFKLCNKCDMVHPFPNKGFHYDVGLCRVNRKVSLRESKIVQEEKSAVNHTYLPNKQEVKGGEGLIAYFSYWVKSSSYRQTLRFCLHHPSPSQSNQNNRNHDDVGLCRVDRRLFSWDNFTLT